MTRRAHPVSWNRDRERFLHAVVACATLAVLACCSRSELDFGDTGLVEPPADDDAGERDATTEDGSKLGTLADGGVGDGSSAPEASTDLPGTVASALQIDPAHDGTIDDPLLVGPLARLWSVTLPAPISYPIIARDIVVVVTSNGGDASQAQLFAFHGHTGAPAWGPIDLGIGGPFSSAAEFGAATYEGGRVFTTETDGLVRAFDVLTGDALWSTPWPNDGAMYADGSPPTAYAGIVYLEGVGPTDSTFELAAFDESDGRVLWQETGLEIFGCDPAVTGDGAFMSLSGQHTVRFDRLTGSQIWSFFGESYGGGGAWTPVVAGGLVYARQDDDVLTNIIAPPYILQVANGADAGTFSSGSPPAVHDGHLFVLSHGIVSSVDSLGQNTAWSFGDGTLVTPAIVASGRVFVGSSSGTLYGLDESTGAKVWSDDVAVGFRALQEGNGNIEPTALSAAGGLLVAPAGTSLVVYGVMADGGMLDGAIYEGGTD